MLRIYDKTAELALPGREAKRALEHSLWKGAGWNGEQVTRVEFQLRGRCLDEMGLRDPGTLEDRVDAVWQHAVKRFRLVDEGSASRLTRCALDSRWGAVARVVFVHDHVSPIRRDRQARGGATASHVRGTVLSLLAATGQLEPVGDPSMETFADEVDKRFRLAGSHVSFDLLKKYGSRAPAAFAAMVAAKCAQFASVDDETEENK